MTLQGLNTQYDSSGVMRKYQQADTIFVEMAREYGRVYDYAAELERKLAEKDRELQAALQRADKAEQDLLAAQPKLEAYDALEEENQVLKEHVEQVEAVSEQLALKLEVAESAARRSEPEVVRLKGLLNQANGKISYWKNLRVDEAVPDEWRPHLQIISRNTGYDGDIIKLLAHHGIPAPEVTGTTPATRARMKGKKADDLALAS